MDLKNLTPEKKDLQMNICSQTLKTIKKNPELIEKVITCDELWFVTYDPETKCQLMYWKTPQTEL